MGEWYEIMTWCFRIEQCFSESCWLMIRSHVSHYTWVGKSWESLNPSNAAYLFIISHDIHIWCSVWYFYFLEYNVSESLRDSVDLRILTGRCFTSTICWWNFPETQLRKKVPQRFLGHAPLYILDQNIDHPYIYGLCIHIYEFINVIYNIRIYI